MEPSYRTLLKSGRLMSAARQLFEYYRCCTLCARECRVNRVAGERGTCSAGILARVSSAHAHFGEEQPLVGRHGSGTIFLSHCSLLCQYCQNWDISHLGEGEDVADEKLALLMLRLQRLGCHNINFVTPTHYLPNLVHAIALAAEKGLNIPIVYNTGGYEQVEILRILNGIVDIYLPDFKYSDSDIAGKYSQGAHRYAETAKQALKEMHRQVGMLITDPDNIAVRGLMIRHLVLPNRLAGSEEFVKFVARELDPGTYVNIMAQYRPCYQAHRYPDLSRGITSAEYREVLALCRKYRLSRLD